MNKTSGEVWVRAMQQEDVLAVLAIETVVHEFPWTEQIFRDCIQVGYATWIIENASGLLGFAVASNMVSECHILNISIKPSEQHKGYGRQLMLAVLENAQTLAVTRAYLEVIVTNGPAIALYHQL